jgi:two-component system, NtrC family, C4-dicarboxylate transport sensor histidine kinase DctB
MRENVDIDAPCRAQPLRGPLATWRAALRRVRVILVVGRDHVYFTNVLLTERFTETTRNRAELRLALYTGNVQSELQRNSVVPLLLSRDPALIGALNSEATTPRRRSA